MFKIQNYVLGINNVTQVHLLAISSCVFVRTIGVYSEACFSVAEGLVRREEDQNGSFRGSKSRNKVSVGEPAEGSLPNSKLASLSAPLPLSLSLRVGEVCRGLASHETGTSAVPAALGRSAVWRRASRLVP